MKKTYFILLVLFSSVSLFAQSPWTYGIKAGANLSGFHTKNSTNTDLHGFQVGGLVNYQATDIFAVQAELHYLQKGGAFTKTEIGSGSFKSYYTESKLSYLEVPLVAQLIVFKKLRVEIGPQISFLVSDKTSIDGEEIESDPNSTDLGLAGGLSYYFNHAIFVQTRYVYGLQEVFEDYSYKNSVVTLSVGYLF